MKRVLLGLLAITILGAVFVLGYVVSGLIEDYFEANKAREAALQEKPPEPTPSFVEQLSHQDIQRFNQLYQQRQEELRATIEAGAQGGLLPLPEGLPAQVGMIDSGMKAIGEIAVLDTKDKSLRQSLLRSYELLKECYEKEADFLNGFQTEGQNINFITSHLFDINSKDQASGREFLSFLKSYRESLSSAITESQSSSNNEAKFQALIDINSLIEKYEKSLEGESGKK